MQHAHHRLPRANLHLAKTKKDTEDIRTALLPCGCTANTPTHAFICFPMKASGHLGLALKLHQSPEMESSGEKNQILICKMGKGERKERERAGGTWEG